MLCENCKQKDATSIYLSQENKLIYLCGKCYKLKNSEEEMAKFAFEQTQTVKITAKCLNCGTSMNEFSSSGYFGCSECFDAFEEFMQQKFLNLFKEKQYLGKKPNIYYIDKQIKELEQMIEICLKNGNFNDATKYGLEVEKLKEQKYDRL